MLFYTKKCFTCYCWSGEQYTLWLRFRDYNELPDGLFLNRVVWVYLAKRLIPRVDHAFRLMMVRGAAYHRTRATPTLTR